MVDNSHVRCKFISWNFFNYITYSVSFVFDAWAWPYRDRTVNVPWPYRDRFRLFVPMRYCVPTRSFLGVPDRSPSLTVHRSWPFTVSDRSPFLSVHDRFWAFMTVPDRFWPFPSVFDRFMSVFDRFMIGNAHKTIENARERSGTVNAHERSGTIMKG